jgi:uncharacterized protein
VKADLYTYVGVFSRGLDTLAHVLAKGAEFAKEKGVSETEMLDWRLVPDMFTLRQQAHSVIQFASQWPARAAGLEIPPGLEGETSLADLQAAIQTTKASLAALKPEQFAGRDEATATVSLGQMEPTFTIGQWLPGFATPNFYFHLSMAYAILRSKGVQIGKRDFFAGGL